MEEKTINQEIVAKIPKRKRGDMVLVEIRQHAGKNDRIMLDALMKRCQATSNDVHSAIERFRSKGEPICGSTSKGYYYATNSSEIEDEIENLESLVRCINKQIDSLRETRNMWLDVEKAYSEEDGL